MPNTKPDHKGSVQDFFNDGADSWEARYGQSDFESISYQDRMHATLTLLEAHGGGQLTLLDAGCGAGLQSAAMEQAGHRVFACDIAPQMAKKARANLKDGHGRVLVSDLEHIPFAPGSFDAVVILGVIGYSKHPERLLGAARTVLKDNGVLVISTANETLLLTRLSDLISYLPDRIYLGIRRLFTSKRPLPIEQGGFYKGHYNYTTAPDFDRQITAGGFLKRGGIGVNYGRIHLMGKRPLSERTDVALSRLVSRLACVPPFRFLQRYARIYVTCFIKNPHSGTRESTIGS